MLSTNRKRISAQSWRVSVSLHKRKRVSDALSRPPQTESTQIAASLRQIAFHRSGKKFNGRQTSGSRAPPLRASNAVPDQFVSATSTSSSPDEPSPRRDTRIDSVSTFVVYASRGMSQHLVRAVQYTMQFFVKFLFDNRIWRAAQCPRKSIRGRFMSRKKKGDGFVAQLLVSCASRLHPARQAASTTNPGVIAFARRCAIMR